MSENYEAFDRDALLQALRTLASDLEDLRTSYEVVMEHNSALENELYARNASLQLGLIEQSSQLQASREINEKTRQQLVMSEKLAKLGELVAGMTHELNTPIGVAFTAASFQQSCGANLSRVLAENQGRVLDGDLLAAFRAELEALGETSAMLQNNLSRATGIVSSFKQMAADQVSDKPRSFSLSEIVGQTLQSLKPRLRQTPVKVELDCPEGIRFLSYPGVISQIITNLVINSLVHGFGGDGQGTIRIAAVLDESANPPAVRLTHRDDGRGIAPEVLPHIFDQFFTTGESVGGTGLGLFIVQTLVTRQLGGAINCRSQPAEAGHDGWTEFEIILPLHTNPAQM